jgi:hypothetical protein
MTCPATSGIGAAVSGRATRDVARRATNVHQHRESHTETMDFQSAYVISPGSCSATSYRRSIGPLVHSRRKYSQKKVARSVQNDK